MLLASVVFGPPEWLFSGFVAALILGTAALVGHLRARRERAHSHKPVREHTRLRH